SSSSSSSLRSRSRKRKRKRKRKKFTRSRKTSSQLPGLVSSLLGKRPGNEFVQFIAVALDKSRALQLAFRLVNVALKRPRKQPLARRVVQQRVRPGHAVEPE